MFRSYLGCLGVSILLVVLNATVVVRAESTTDGEILGRLASRGVISTSIGVTRNDSTIDALISPEDLDFQTKKTRILVVANGADGAHMPSLAMKWMEWFYADDEAAKYRELFALSAIPDTNPDGSVANSSAPRVGTHNPAQSFPPKGDAYGSKANPEAAYVWRWIGMHAPDVVVELTPGDAVRWRVASAVKPTLNGLVRELREVADVERPDSLAAQLGVSPASDVGTIPALEFSSPNVDDDAMLKKLLDAMISTELVRPSPARREMQRRLARSARAISQELLEVYGKEIKQVVYIQSLAVIGRMRHIEQLAKEQNAKPDYDPINAIVDDYLDGKRIAALKSGSDLSGHLLFTELAARSEGNRRDRCIELARAAADLAFDERGKIQTSMPFHSEMSDALFMGGPILAQVGRLTDETKYFDACKQHLQFMMDLDLREDNLYRHSPLDETAWGRGNGFPAIGVAMCLDAFPHDHPARPELLKRFQNHMAALVQHQDPTGCWHQIIDHPESYREFTATCMITYAMIRGVTNGWLDKNVYLPVIERAWYAIRTRIGRDGKLVDVCTGTGKQKSRRDYYDRTAILGRDDRGGAMALLVANEVDASAIFEKALRSPKDPSLR
ncbi:MAG: glycoside hydrolase family 88 protein [Planctomycetaceae bacterium]|nr:glycoside hydrolase family 88 protein [Planctomycetales bacterium]MCB9925881.1 glycoside hydrolase family 88 protein [Planctomycetaceae bacterium]